MSVGKTVSGAVIAKDTRDKEALNRGTYAADVTVTGFVKRGGHKYDVDYRVVGDVVVKASPERTASVIDPKILASFLLPYLTPEQASEVSHDLLRKVKALKVVNGKVSKLAMNPAGEAAADALITIIKGDSPKTRPNDMVTAEIR